MKSYAKHYETGEAIPDELIEKIRMTQSLLEDEEIQSLKDKWLNLKVSDRKVPILDTLTPEEISWIEENPVITLGADSKWAPLDFLDSQGYDVTIADPADRQGPYEQLADWNESRLDHDIIVVAAPLKISAGILEDLAERRPQGLIFDLGSLKTPLACGLAKLADAGCRVTSIHPMFGPDTRLLSGCHVIFVDVGCPDATKAAMALFEPTMAERVTMELEAHDRLIAYVLGLSHALNIAFFTALAESGEDVPHLAGISSTTFDNQLEVASRVAEENPSLYFEIQALNEYGMEPLQALEKSVTDLVSTIRSGDEDRFVAIMSKGREYLAARREASIG